MIQARADELLRGMEQRTGDDIATDFARPLPFGVIANVLGVERDRHDWLEQSMAVLGRGFTGQRRRPPVEAANAAAADMLAYFGGLLRRRAEDPRDDLASRLAVGSDAPDERRDLLANCIFLLLAGHATTTTLLCAGLDLLTARPELVRRLLENDTGLDRCIEELLRYVSPITLTGVSTDSAVVVAGHLIALPMLLTACRASRSPALPNTAAAPCPTGGVLSRHLVIRDRSSLSSHDNARSLTCGGRRKARAEPAVPERRGSPGDRSVRQGRSTWAVPRRVGPRSPPSCPRGR